MTGGQLSATVLNTNYRRPESDTMDNDISLKVEKGINTLNATLGTDWSDHIDLETLDMENPNMCIIGQLTHNYGDTLGHTYAIALESLAPGMSNTARYDWAVAHGLDSTTHNGYSDWHSLHMEWFERLER